MTIDTNVDEKIAAERHSALGYSSYSSGSVPNKKSSTSPFIRLSYVPKKAAIFGGLAVLILAVGTVGAIAAYQSRTNGSLAKNTEAQNKESEESEGYIEYDGNETTNDGTVIEDSTDTAATSSDDSSNIVSDTFEAMGLIKKETSSSTGSGTSTPSSSTSGSSSSGSSSSSGGSSSGGSSSTPSAPVPKVTKLLVFLAENHSYSAMKNDMPFTYSLAKQYAHATQYFATHRPSLPNYIAIASGSNRGIKDNNPPSDNKFEGTSVFGQAIRNGKTAAVYSESIPSNCATKDSGKYAVKHNPWPYVSNERSWCKTYNLPMSGFNSAVTAGTLPNAGMVVPNMCNSGHDCPISTTDTWLKKRVENAMSGPDWKAKRLAIVILSEEAAKTNTSNHVFFVLVHQSQKANAKSCKLNHYSLSRLYSSVTKTSPILNAKSAASVSSCFNLPI
ncbi:TPA: hypothetical protein DIV49_00800 [Candidatus Saccharibacteria bacterium]|nr:hypothetical protein [Candidatus Saccharibacteria bacterium]HRJ90836.1 alkaline phosphatase family protein [Candidatus Saccharibacteria bacterium]